MCRQNIVEWIDGKGVKTTNHNWYRERCRQPKPGDLIDFHDFEGIYPLTHGRYGRITNVNDDRIIFCCELGSAFLSEGPFVSVSGGPFESVLPNWIEPTYLLGDSPMWNWGDNSPGGNQGVFYDIQRPIFKLLKHPADKDICELGKHYAK